MNLTSNNILYNKVRNLILLLSAHINYVKLINLNKVI